MTGVKASPIFPFLDNQEAGLLTRKSRAREAKGKGKHPRNDARVASSSNWPTKPAGNDNVNQSNGNRKQLYLEVDVGHLDHHGRPLHLPLVLQLPVLLPRLQGRHGQLGSDAAPATPPPAERGGGRRGLATDTDMATRMDLAKIGQPLLSMYVCMYAGS